jgi:PhnB protein
MTAAVRHVPEGHSTVSPYLVTAQAERSIELMVKALGGQEIHRSTRSDGAIMHAEVKIGDTVVMISEASPEFPAMPCMLNVYVRDCDAAYARALELGATSLREPASQFYGDRTGGVRDAGGNQWWIATHEEDVAADEIERRARAAGR